MKKGKGEKTGGSIPRRRRVLLIDDHPLIMEGLAGILNLEPDLEVCGQAASATQAMHLIGTLSPDAVIVDLTLADGCGFDLLRDIQLRFPRIPALVVSMHDECLYAERALRAGARGYVMKQDPPERVLQGVRAVMEGDLFVSPSVAGTLLHAFVSGSHRDEGLPDVGLLNNRELEVFEGIGNGMSTSEIAARLKLSPKTILTYRAHIRRKLGLANSHRLVQTAIHWVEQDALPPPQ